MEKWNQEVTQDLVKCKIVKCATLTIFQDIVHTETAKHGCSGGHVIIFLETESVTNGEAETGSGGTQGLRTTKILKLVSFAARRSGRRDGTQETRSQ